MKNTVNFSRVKQDDGNAQQRTDALRPRDLVDKGGPGFFNGAQGVACAVNLPSPAIAIVMPNGFPELPPLNALRVFEVVARHLNFRLAAEELGVTQAAVAQQIRGLEAHLKLRLFERLPRGLALTDAGLGYSASIRSAWQ